MKECVIVHLYALVFLLCKLSKMTTLIVRTIEGKYRIGRREEMNEHAKARFSEQHHLRHINISKA